MNSLRIKEIAREYGFSYCGIAEAGLLKPETALLQKWIDSGFHSTLSYMERNITKRTNPALLVENAKSIIVLAMNYYPGEEYQKNTKFKVAKYAMGEDYHAVLSEKAEQLAEEIKKECGDYSFSCFVDSAPVMEKAWAVKAGLGRIGKHGLLIIPEAGSFFLLCEIITDLPLKYDKPFDEDLCGECTVCMDSCPAKAIVGPGVIDTWKCIAALTIEKKGADFSNDNAKLYNRIFGCDICQDVCPHNHTPKISTKKSFTPHPFFRDVTDEGWENMTENEFKDLFKNSPLKRASFKGIQYNMRKIQKD